MKSVFLTLIAAFSCTSIMIPSDMGNNVAGGGAAAGNTVPIVAAFFAGTALTAYLRHIQVTSERNAFAQNLHTINSQLAEAHETVHHLKSQLKETQETVLQRDNQLAITTKQIETFAHQLESAKRINNGLTTDLSKSQEEINKLHSNINKFINEYNETNIENDALTRTNRDIDWLLDCSIRQHKQDVKAISEAQEELTRLRQQLFDTTTALAESEQTAQHHVDAFERVSQDHKKLRQEHEAALQKIREKADEVATDFAANLAASQRTHELVVAEQLEFFKKELGARPTVEQFDSVRAQLQYTQQQLARLQEQTISHRSQNNATEPDTNVNDRHETADDDVTANTERQ